MSGQIIRSYYSPCLVIMSAKVIVPITSTAYSSGVGDPRYFECCPGVRVDVIECGPPVILLKGWVNLLGKVQLYETFKRFPRSDRFEDSVEILQILYVRRTESEPRLFRSVSCSAVTKMRFRLSM